MSSAAAVPQALTALVAALQAEQPADPAHLAAIARWRLACGDGRSAARWQRWSLEPPAPQSLLPQLRDHLLEWQQPHLAQQLGGSAGWAGVRLALEQQQPNQAIGLQEQAIAAGEPISLAASLQLASLWQRHQQPQQALQLLMAIAQQGVQPALCNAIAHLHEQLQQAAEAAPWWDHSLHLDPSQAAVLMQRSRNALALGDAPLAFHLAQALLERDPSHPVGQELRVEALQQLGAPASLRLALVPLVRARRVRYGRLAREQAAWWEPLRREQVAWRPQANPQALALTPPRPVPAELLSGCSRVALLGSRDGLELAGAFSQAAPQGVLWLLDAPDPLCALHNLRPLLPPDWQLQRWPRWAPQVHGPLDRLIEAGSPLPPTRAEAPSPRLHWHNGWQRIP
jgi:hypothetical protein